jgi:ATP-binding cassette subfamily F protein uup
MLALRNIRHGYGGVPLLDGISFEILQGERVCLVGRNGTGKSTLLKIVAGEIIPDFGEIERQPGIRVASLPQEVDQQFQGTISSLWQDGLARESLQEWEAQMRMEKIATSLGLSISDRFETLSSGNKRRALLGYALIQEPDLLVLDEPTNHLDVPSITWMEEFLPQLRCAVLFITHDRMFLQKLATRILDLDRGSVTSWQCDYPTYLVRKEAWLEGEAKQQAVFDKKLAQEEAWIRQGIKARRTRNEGRVRALKAMREEHRARRNRLGTVHMEIEEADRSGVKVIAAENLSFQYGDKTIVKQFSWLISRGDRIGIVGANGTGKTTLLRLLLREIEPQSGSVIHGTGLRIAYFDQLRESLDIHSTVADNIADGNEAVVINGRQIHVMTYLKDFLFTPDRARAPIKQLSGGEKNRLLLARLFTRPFNLLIMDEPTNDLDQETLELLEERLAEYSGTLILVSHDRAFLNSVATELLVLEGNGQIVPVTGGYDDYLALKAHQQKQSKGSTAVVDSAPTSNRGASKPRKFLNRERWELEALPAEIETLEKEQQQWSEKLSDPQFVSQAERVHQAQARMSEIESLLEQKFARWEELETLRQQLDG